MEVEAPLQVGLAEIDITPWLGIELSGYGFFLDRKGTSVREPLLAQAIAFECGGRSALIISADLIGFAFSETLRLRDEISSATGIEPSCIALCATHTHAGPATIFLHGCGDVDPGYMDFLSKRLVDVARLAHSRMAPARLFTAEAPLAGVAFNRTRVDGPVDDALQCLFVEDLEGNLRSVLTRFSCHPVVFRNDNTGISPDFVGYFRSALRAQWPGALPIYLQGACGDLNPNVSEYQGPPEVAVQGVGLAVAGGVLGLFGKRRPLSVDALSGATKVIDLPFAALSSEMVDAFAHRIAPPPERTGIAAAGARRFAQDAQAIFIPKIEQRDLPNVDRVELQQLGLGPLTMLFHGAELFSAPAIALRERVEGLWIVGYSNDFWGYLPDLVDFERNGYAAVTVPYMVNKPPYEPDVGERWVELAASFLHRDVDQR